MRGSLTVECRTLNPEDASSSLAPSAIVQCSSVGENDGLLIRMPEVRVLSLELVKCFLFMGCFLNRKQAKKRKGNSECLTE